MALGFDVVEENIVVKHVEERQIEEALKLINAEGWSLRRQKFELIFKTIPNSIYVMIDKEEVIGCMTAVSVHSFDIIIGNVVVKKSRRRKGLGSWMLQCVISQLIADGKTVSLFSDVDSFYEKLGFRAHIPPCSCYFFYMKLLPGVVTNFGDLNPLPPNVEIQPYQENFQDDVISFDLDTRRHENEAYVKILLSTSDCVLVALDVESCGILGYATTLIREDENVLAFHGIIAVDDMVAFWLFRKMLNHFPGVMNIRIMSTRMKPFLKQFGDVYRQTDGCNQVAMGDGDITIHEEKVYCLNDPDLTY